MRIDAVKATAFGPFMGEALELTPGMNVIFGPNESGKSSWHAAIYAALCGMKKTRGQPTREDRTFANRHRPWRGTTWRVSAAITLDDGRTVEIEQSLGPGGRSFATDRKTKRPLTGDLVQAGAVDAATLLGLTRETALATLFVRQADILRVLTDAGELQEYLERAAATSSANTTAEEALTRIASYKRDRVGLVRGGSRGPLAVASRQLTEAREALDRAEDRFESYQELLGRRHSAEGEALAVEQRLREVVDHEQERQHRERWAEIRAAERRLEQARRLAKEAAAGPRDALAVKELVTAATRALATFDARPAEPLPLDGLTSDELEDELAEIPEAPAGDLEPAREVVLLLDRWRGENQRLAAHDENEPSLDAGRAIPAAPWELRRLADELQLPIPEVDPSLIADIEQRRNSGEVPTTAPMLATSPPAAPSNQRSGRVPLALGGFLAIVGIVLFALGQPIAAAAALLVGVVVVGIGAVTLSRAKTPTGSVTAPRHLAGPAAAPTLDLDLPRLDARLAMQQEAEAHAQRRHDGAVDRIAELGLQHDAEALRQLAAEGDVASSAQTRHIEWQRRRSELEAIWSGAAGALLAALSTRGISVDDGTGPDQAFEAYANACRERAQRAWQAGRRADVEGQLVNRRSAEASREQDAASRAAAEQRLLDIAKEASCEASTVDELADGLRGWVRMQEGLDEARRDQEKTAARLDQLLDGLTLEELEAEIAELTADAGNAPPDDAPALKDRSHDLEALQSNASQRRDTLAELIGQIEGAEGHLLDVSKAIEAEARAATEVAHLTALAEDLDVASAILGAAQDKVHADIAPVLNDTIRPWVPRITRGHFDDIRVNPSTLEIEAHETGGLFRAATVLSHGTTEQLFLLLRLALAERLTTTDETAPVILDDITVQSDTDRTVAALDLLHELSAEHQVVLFSQEDEVLRWAEECLRPPSDRLIRLNGRT
jgi:exonuclease SbcC